MMSDWPVTTTDSYVPVARFATVEGTLRTLATELKLACAQEIVRGQSHGGTVPARSPALLWCGKGGGQSILRRVVMFT